MGTSPNPRVVSDEDLSKERAIWYTLLADIGMTAMQVTFAIATLSLAMAGEAIRASLMLAIEIYALLILRAVHRDRLKRFRFGIGKLELMCNLTIGLGLVFAGIWIGNQVVQSLLFERAAATPSGLAMVATISGLNLVINGLGWFAMVSAARSNDSAIYRGQLRARTVKLLSSACLQVTMTIAALAEDPLIAEWMDALGASIVGILMIGIGLQMVWKCLPDLIDRTIPDHDVAKIRKLVMDAGIAPDEISYLRTRRAGSFPHIEIGLREDTDKSWRQHAERHQWLERLITRTFREADVSVVTATQARGTAVRTVILGAQ